MSGTSNPDVSVGFGDGNSGALPDLATDVFLFFGPASAGPFLKPRRVSGLGNVLTFLNHGPLCGHASHHVVNSQACWAMRSHASAVGTNGAVTTTRATNSVGTAALSNSIFSTHALITSTGAVLNIISGWITPPSPLPMQIVGSAACVSINITLKYIDEAGLPQTETFTGALNGGGTVTTTGNVASVTSLTTNVDPVGTLTCQVTYPGPQDRYDAVWKFVQGGILSGGFVQPQGQWSMDGGKTFSRTLSVPTSGIVDLLSYAGGLTSQATGVRMTFTSAFAAGIEIGSLRVLGADVNGDLIFTGLKTTATLTVVIAGNGTPLSIALVGDAVTINCQTDGGGLCLTTANLLQTFWNSGDANAILARARFRLRTPVGTGASLMAAHVAAALTNCQVNLTPRQEGVTFTAIESGVSLTRSVLVTGPVGAKVVTVTLDTDTNGIRTSTAAQIRDLINNDATASQYFTATASGSGAGLAGDVASIAFVLDWNTGDQFSFSTVPPSMTNADVAEALAAIRARDDVLTAISTVMPVKDGADDTDMQNVKSWINDVQNNKKTYITAVLSAAFQATHDPSPATEANLQQTWATNIINTYVSGRTQGECALIAGEIDTQIPAYGAQPRRNFGMLYCARDAICPISVFASEVQCDTLRGTKQSLDGVGSHLIAGGDPNSPQYTSFWQSDDILQTLHAQNITTPRAWSRLSGVFVRQDLSFTIDGDDWQLRPFRRVGDVIGTLAYLTAVLIINKPMLTDQATGVLLEMEHLKIEGSIRAVLRSKLYNDDGRQHAAGLQVVSDRAVNFKLTRKVSLAVNFITKDPAINIGITVNAVRTIQS